MTPSAGERKVASVAIVTTLRDAAPLLDSFIAYHLAVGFDRLFLFFDDPHDPAVRIARAFPHVTATVHDQDLRSRWERGAAYRTSAILRDFADREVMARQLLNVEVAIEMALDMQIDWLLHIDVDELFFTPEQTVHAHFESLAARGVSRATYLNHEAVPETADVTDPFREVTLFKRNPLATPSRASVSTSASVPASRFSFYSNGKSAARVRPGLRATGVHGFRQAAEMGRRATLLNRVLRSKAARASRSLERVATASSRRLSRSVTLTSPAVLHYPCCGFEAFWQKYETLGAFADTWFGRDDIASKIGSFHLESRDVVAAGDKQAARAFYERRMVLGDPSDVAALLDAEVLCRITEPARLLEGMTRERGLRQQHLEQWGARDP